MLHTVVNSCSSASHTQLELQNQPLSFQNEYNRQMEGQQKRKCQTYTNVQLMNEEIKTLLALGPGLKAFTITLCENDHARLSNYVSGNLCMPAMHTVIWRNNRRLFFFITCILTYTQHHA